MLFGSAVPIGNVSQGNFDGNSTLVKINGISTYSTLVYVRIGFFGLAGA